MEVRYGADILGRAVMSSGSKGLVTGTNHRPRMFRGVFLRFESAEQARVAAGVLHWPEVNPTPLPNQKGDH